MKKSVQNYILIIFGATVIILVLSFHFLDTIGRLLYDYNALVRYINKIYDAELKECEVFFFGKGYKEISLILDTVLLFVIILVSSMIFLKIYLEYKRK